MRVIMSLTRVGALVLVPGPARARRAVVRGWAHRHRWTLGATAVMLLAAVVRLRYVLSTDFPLGDGGLFSSMAGEIEQAKFRLPLFTSYNGGQIPFAYPPAGLYTAALLDAALPCGLTEILRFVPSFVNTLTVGAVIVLAQTITRRRGVALLSGTVFALYPMSYLWLIMGGGITRAFGLLFAVLAVRQVYHLCTRAHPGSLAGVIALAALTAMSHLEAAVFVLASSALLLAVYGDRGALYRLVLAAAGAALCASPWWATVMARHGVTPFWLAGQTGGGLLLFALVTLPMRLLPLPLAAIPLAVVLCLLWARRHHWTQNLVSLRERPVTLLACWMLVLLLADLRAWLTYSAVPLAMLVGTAVLNTVATLRPLTAVGLARSADPTPHPQPPVRVRTLALAASSALAFIVLWWSGLVVVRPPEELAGLTASEREAMRWVQEQLPADSRWLVITDGEHWESDRVAEWFPALAQRVSLVTPQGQEWRPRFVDAVSRHRAAQRCAHSRPDCLTTWSQGTGLTFTHVYVAKLTASSRHSADCCTELRTALRSDPGYALVYDGPGASIFVRRAPSLTSSPEERR
ncbi:MAG: hypothetical protein C4290_01645 [Chloroflexota bacterium]